MSEDLIPESVNPQYDERLFIKFPQKIQVQNMLYTKIVLNVKTKTHFCTQHVLNFLGEFNEQSLDILWVN